MKVYILLATLDYNVFDKIVYIFYTREQAVKYMMDNVFEKDKPYPVDWDIIESELYPATNIL